VLTPQEEEAYLQKAGGDLKDAAILDIETGLRPDSELFPLKWENVTDAGIRGIRGKTKSAFRTVPLSPRAKAVLEMRRSAGQDDSPFVFPSNESASGHLMTIHPGVPKESTGIRSLNVALTRK
jgi:integrase